MKNIRFTFMVDEQERKALSRLAQFMERTKSDAIRFLIREAMIDVDNDFMQFHTMTRKHEREKSKPNNRTVNE